MSSRDGLIVHMIHELLELGLGLTPDEEEEVQHLYSEVRAGIELNMNQFSWLKRLYEEKVR